MMSGVQTSRQWDVGNVINPHRFATLLETILMVYLRLGCETGVQVQSKADHRLLTPCFLVAYCRGRSPIIHLVRQQMKT